MTGVGYYNSEPRNYNRGFARGTSKPSQQSQRHSSPQPLRSGGDPFMEAGRLAVEYLISRGLLNDLHSSQDRHTSRSSVDQDQRSYSRERRRLGPSRSYGSNLTHDNEKEGTLTEEPYLTRAMEVNSDAGLKDTTSKDTGIVVQVTHPAEPATNNDTITELQDDTGKGCAIYDLDLETTSLVQRKDDEESMKPSDAMEFEETKIGADDHGKEKDTVMDDLAIQLGEVNSNSSSKRDSLLISEETNVSTTGLNSLNTKNFNIVNDLEKVASSKSLGPGVFELSFGDVEVVNHPENLVDEKKSVEPLSFRDKTFSYEEKFSGLPVLGLCNSIGVDIGEKRPISIEEDTSMEDSKKAKRQRISVAQSDEFSQLSDLSDKHSVSPVKTAVKIFNVPGSQASFASVSLPLKSCVDSNKNEGEKQLLSNSFKICDLNLMEASDMHENHENHLLYPTISGPSQDLLDNIDLSMRNDLTSEYNASGSVGKAIEIIDLKSTSLEDCKSSTTSMKNPEASMTTMENFSNQHNATENPDAQDGCGFMISELLGNEFPTPVQPDMNYLHDDMGLNHLEGMFSEDDPIYMSLGFL